MLAAGGDCCQLLQTVIFKSVETRRQNMAAAAVVLWQVRPRAAPPVALGALMAIATSATIMLVKDLPALLCAGGMLGDFLGGLLIFASIISMLEIEFSIEGNPEKRSKK